LGHYQQTFSVLGIKDSAGCVCRTVCGCIALHRQVRLGNPGNQTLELKVAEAFKLGSGTPLLRELMLHHTIQSLDVLVVSSL
jgi:hypothetical protein